MWGMPSSARRGRLACCVRISLTNGEVGGGDFRYEAVFYEEMARRSLSGMNASVHSIVAHYLLNHGTPEQKQRYLPRMCTGELVGAIAMTEPDRFGFAGHSHTRADKPVNFQVNGHTGHAQAVGVGNAFIDQWVAFGQAHPARGHAVHIRGQQRRKPPVLAVAAAWNVVVEKVADGVGRQHKAVGKGLCEGVSWWAVVPG